MTNLKLYYYPSSICSFVIALPVIFQSQGNDRLMFLFEIDLSSEVPSSWMAALDMLQKK